MRQAVAFHRAVDRPAALPGDIAARHKITIASEELLIKLLQYGMKYGLPNLSSEDCRQRLRTIKRNGPASKALKIIDVRVRPCPGDFAERNAEMSRAQLQLHYRASDETIGRWRRDLRGGA
jgi:hypothetical protein